jgi:single-stranded DNA-binding protein
MSTLNKCLFIGNLTRNVHLAETRSGLSVANFTLAVSSLRKEPKGAPCPATIIIALGDN